MGISDDVDGCNEKLCDILCRSAEDAIPLKKPYGGKGKLFLGGQRNVQRQLWHVIGRSDRFGDLCCSVI